MKDYFEKIYRAIDYAEEKLHEEIEVSDLSKEAGISLYHFTRLFKTVTGETPHAYVRKRRLSEAKDEILKDKAIIQTAFDYGWNSQESFTYAFSRYFGTSPGRIRNRSHQPIGLRKPLKHKERYIFMNGTQIWKLENLAQQLYSLSQAWALESVNLGPLGRGLNIVASETRRLYDELIDSIEKTREGANGDIGGDLESLSEKMKILTLNSVIEALHTYQSIGRPSLVSANELKALNHKFNKLIFASEEDWLSDDIPEVLEASTVTNGEYYFIKFNIGNKRFCENIVFVKELIINRKTIDFGKQREIEIRGEKLPIVFGDSISETDEGFGRYMLVMGNTLEDSVAVPVETLRINDVFISPLGQREVKSNGENSAFPLRESWKAADGGFIDFIDWDAMR